MKDHLSKAAEYASKGDAWYAKAADEIIAAREERPLTWKQVAEGVGKSDTWCRRIVEWRVSGDANLPNPDWKRGSHATAQEITDGARRLLQTATSEQIREIMQDVPDEQRDEVLQGIVGTPAEVIEKKEEAHRDLIQKQPMFGWMAASEGLVLAKRGLRHAVDALIKLAINSRVNPDDDMLRVARDHAEEIGRAIHELEMTWGETPISDTIEELKGARA